MLARPTVLSLQPPHIWNLCPPFSLVFHVELVIYKKITITITIIINIVQVHNPNILCRNNKQIVTYVQDLKYRVLHFHFGIDVVSWPLKKHPIVTLSSTKYKYVTATSATSQTILMHRC